MKKEKAIRSVEIRRCAKCGSNNMRPDLIEWDGFGNQWRYICPNCDHVRIIEPIGSTASTIMVSILAMGVFAAFILLDRFSDWTSWVWWGAGWVVFLFFPMKTILVHYRYPVIGTTEQVIEVDVLEDPLQKGIEKIEKQSFWPGFLSPLFLIVLILGASMLYGMIDFYYF